MHWLLRLMEFPSRAVLIVLTVVAAVGFVIIGGRMQALGVDIVALEFVWTPERTRALLDAWGPEKHEAARKSLWLDFPFIVTYALLLMGLVLFAARGSSGWCQGLGLGLALMPWLAGLLDVVENLCLLRVLATPTEPPSALLVGLAGACATVKFALVLGCTLYVLLVGGARLVGLVRGR
jgi:hypothetical protein